MTTDTHLTAGSRDLRRLDGAMLCAALAAFGMLYSTQALLPSIGSDLDVSPTAASLTVSAAAAGLALAMLPLTLVAESVGRVALMRTGLVTVCLLTFATAVAPNLWTLVTLRASVGVALAGVVAVGVAHVGSEVHPAVLGRAVGVYVAGNTLGGISGRIVPGLAQEAGSWRFGVAAVGVMAAVAVAGFLWLLPRPRQRTTPGAGPHLAAVRRVLGDGAIVRLCVLSFLLMGGFVACYNYATFRLGAPPLGLSTTLASMVFLAYLAGTVSSSVAGRLSDRLGRKPLALSSITLALAGLALTLPDTIAWVLVGLLLFTAGFFATHSVATSWVTARAGADRGPAAAAYLLAYYLGSGIFGALIGLPYEAAGWPAAVVAVGALFALGALVVASVPVHRR